MDECPACGGSVVCGMANGAASPDEGTATAISVSAGEVSKRRREVAHLLRIERSGKTLAISLARTSPR
jgi:hypothetical protein